jgi:hypothetical protein
MLHRGPDMSPRDMRLMAVSGEAAGSAGTEPLAVDLCGPLGFCRLATPSYRRSVSQPALGRTELPAAVGS